MMVLRLNKTLVNLIVFVKPHTGKFIAMQGHRTIHKTKKDGEVQATIIITALKLYPSDLCTQTA